jgi:hypothetical protein
VRQYHPVGKRAPPKAAGRQVEAQSEESPQWTRGLDRYFRPCRN